MKIYEMNGTTKYNWKELYRSTTLDQIQTVGNELIAIAHKYERCDELREGRYPEYSAVAPRLILD